MRIDVSELKTISEKLLSALESFGYDQIELEQDYYWDIPEEAKYEMEKPPVEFGIGQISEDWEFLKKVMDPDRVPIGDSYVWLGKILEIIGEKIIH